MAQTKSKSARKPRKPRTTRVRKSTTAARQATPSAAPGAGEPVPIDVPIAGAERPPEPPAPDPTPAPTLEEQRALARAERRRLREQRRQAPAPVKVPAPVKAPAPVVPIESARKSKPATSSGEPEPVVVPLNGERRWKLEALNLRAEQVERAVREPLLAQLKAAVEKKISEAVKGNPACQAARRAQAEYVNELITAITPTLPEGYAVVQLEPERERVVCRYLPEQVGKLLEVPE